MRESRARWRVRIAAAACAAICLIAAAGRAQASAVVPPAFASSEAPGVAFWALSPFAARRQLVVGGGSLQALAGSQLRSISVRRNMGSTDPVLGGRLHLRVDLGYARTTPAGMSTRFADNMVGPGTRVFDGTIVLPSAGAAPSTPAPWTAPYAVTIAFTTPFAYAGGDLCIETATYPEAGSASWWTVDAAVATGTGSVTTYGTSCIAGMGTRPAGVEPASLTVGATAAFYLRGARTSGQAYWAVGTSRTKFGPLTLPVNLGVYGAPGCELHTNATLWTPVAILAQGNGSLGLAGASLRIPASASVAGVSVFTQWAVADAGANALNMTFSSSVQATIGVARQSWDCGWLESTDPTGATGRLLTGRVPVLRIDG